MKVLYTAEVTVTGGRSGLARSRDGALEVKMSVPKEMGGSGGQGTNPEQLFAAGFAACFQSALMGPHAASISMPAPRLLPPKSGLDRQDAADMG